MAEYKAIASYRRERVEESLRNERQRELRLKEHKAEVATANLYNAVRRGDVKAVCALLAAGADPQSTAPDGATLFSIALSKNREDIAAELHQICNPQTASATANTDAHPGDSYVQ